MEFMISGRNVTVSDRFREYATEKLSKLEALGDKVQRIDTKVAKKAHSRAADNELTVEVTVVGRGPVIRAEAVSGDKFAAFDLAYAKLQERLRRAKDRRKVHHGRHTPKAVHEATAALNGAASAEAVAASSPYEIANDIPAGDSPVLIRRKVFPAATMTVDEAVDNMELVGHAFYLFVDKETEQHSVVYRRTGWTYGVITLDPACAEGKGEERIHAYRSDDEDVVVGV
ncbi:MULTISPECIES: ribosome-associated translation inhibitor RaiA [Arthrobacter]|uniref:Ribosome hibernation promoting factor n=2 Tax=Arthrobacter TaxID=1663 RepID=A0ABU9KKM8_9MICC|nr:ribosome-associated translation inhibitor RaiA [Arthrobacter sp. YJM1]MDP5227217.1 ribosome-associated translation inhibitor RaiA [Arthrobacter sp. YJM1]